MFEKIRLLENAHLSLMEEYVDVINATSKLPFLVDIFSLGSFEFKTRLGPKSLRIIKLISYIPRFIAMLFCWKPLVQFFVESHIKFKLDEIRAGYIQFSQRLTPFMKSSKEYQWVIGAEKSLGEFSSTLSPWKNMNGIGYIVLNVIVGLYGVRTIYELLPRIPKLSPSDVFVFAKGFGLGLTNFITLLVVLLILPFLAKRFLFNPNGPKNIYHVEDKIFEVVQKAKRLELPVDFLFLLIYLVIYPMLILFVASWAATQGFSLSIQFHDTDIPLLISFLINYVFPLMIYSVLFFILWRKREWR